ncbi:MAG: FAD-dependent oxidoreductase [Hyphomicrobiaceae bacterium]
MTSLRTTCAIAGGGPAGMMAGHLLARAGIDVVVLEKHADFLRDFRGDTVHPSTLEVMDELGLIERFLARPHQKVRRLAGKFGDTELIFADFSSLPVRHRYIAMMPQWELLDFLAEEGRRFAGFGLRMRAEVTDLVEADGRVRGLHARTPEGPLEIAADLVIGADGRHSRVRECAGLEVESIGAPMDVLWFRVSRKDSDPDDTTGRFDAGRISIMINRGDYWQCAFVIPKGSVDEVHARGLAAFREAVAKLAPFLGDRLGEIASFDDVKLLTVAVDRLTNWTRPGLLCIGDCAHAMSPVGGIGINLAVQDAVAAANILAAPLRAGRASEADLQKVEARRLFPTRMTQRLQVFIQNRVIAPTLKSTTQLQVPLAVRLLTQVPLLRRLPARLIGLGIRPEHVETKAA